MNMSIPKIIHLCWFGENDFPPLAKKCINSWKDKLPDFEIRICNEDKFDVNCCSYTKKAYADKKWAFVSDYARLKRLYEDGGVYMDTDLEVIRNFEGILEGKRFVSSYIEGGLITAGFIACEPHHPFVEKLLSYYQRLSEHIDEGKTIEFEMNPLIFTRIAITNYSFSIYDKYFQNDEMTIYPYEYLMPFRKYSFGHSYDLRCYHITNNTYTVHHDMSSWKKRKRYKKICKACVRLIVPEFIYNKFKIKRSAKRLEL